ncbi:MAG: NAD(P)/FAD-dependent oxidoreductase [Myxococcota bacterium]
MSTHVVIIGGGFGGLAAAKRLRRANVRITLIDRTNHHLFQPLLYQVATAGLAPSDIAEPIRSILSGQKNLQVRLAEVTAVDLGRKSLTLSDEAGHTSELSWDKLIVAAGARHSYFGHDEWAEHAPGLKTIQDALEVRRRILSAFERAEWTDDEAEREALLTFVVVGGGPTGVELAGAIAEIARKTLRRDYQRIDTTKARVLLLEGADAVLTAYPPSLQRAAKRQLEQLSVDVRLQTKVTGVDDGGVWTGGDFLPAKTVLWAAGVQGSRLARTLDVMLDRNGRVVVEEDLSVPGHPDAFVVGDLAAARDGRTGKPVPGVAPAATQMGTFAARMVHRDLRGRARKVFHYFDKGSLATVGRSRAVADVAGVQVSGLPAWVAWVGVHVWFLNTFRNQALVMTKWAWAWATWEKATRLVWQDAPPRATGPSDRARASGE